jgi:hypothetical protein
MSLFSVDKNSMDRSNPSPNTHDQLSQDSIKAHQTLSTSYSLNASTSSYDKRIQYQNNQIIVYDGTNERIIIGVLPDGTYGMAISKEGYDVSGAFS